MTSTDATLAARYYLDLAAAFVRGRLPHLAAMPPEALLERGTAEGLRLHKFKRNAGLPRVRRVLGLLRGLAPQSLLDVGSGRGTFLWPLLESFPELAVTAIDHDARRAADLQAVSRGGVARLSAAEMDASRLTFPDGHFDGVTLLEVLEHLERPEAAAAEALRVASRFIVASVPSQEDENPDHIHLFGRESLAALFTRAGARRVTTESVLNHIIAVVQV
jgi:2-polyprenyl-3-methyl-5-hydroxy-6-metoxy-1,4-benzoquinol methylase